MSEQKSDVVIVHVDGHINELLKGVIALKEGKQVKLVKGKERV